MSVTILQGDVRVMLATLAPESVQCVVTSPPYFRLRSYLPADHPDKVQEIGSEQTPAEFVAALVNVFESVRRVMRPDAVLFVNLGDSYAGSGKGPPSQNGLTKQQSSVGSLIGGRTPTIEGVKPKSLFLVPQRFAIAMQDAGWIVRQEIVWAKRAPMPESVRDRCTSAWEPIYMFTKQARYCWDQDAVRQPYNEASLSRYDTPKQGTAPSRLQPGEDTTRNVRELGMQSPNPNGANLRNVWDLAPEPSRENHYAAFPSEIPRRCILAASRPGDTVLDPFLGSGTTALVADQLGRNAVGCELNPEYAEMARRRISNDSAMFAEVSVEDADARTHVAEHAVTQLSLMGEVA